MLTVTAPNVLDHQNEEPIAREQVNKFLISKGVKEGITCPLIFTRFTPNEYRQISLCYPGDIFTHVNLQHYGVPVDLEHSHYQLGVKIQQPGLNLMDRHVAPEINLGSGIVLKQVKLQYSLRVEEPIKHENLLLEDRNGILDSLYSKYSNVMNIGKNEIAKMKYFARTLEVVDYIKLDI